MPDKPRHSTNAQIDQNPEGYDTRPIGECMYTPSMAGNTGRPPGERQDGMTTVPVHFDDAD